MMSSADTVKNLRLELNCDQQELADRLNITRSAIHNYEKGLRKPKLSIIKRMKELAEIHGLIISVEDFLND